MKNSYKILMVFAIFLVSSCGLTDLDHLDDPNKVTPDNAEISLFFNSIQLDFKDFFMAASDQTMPVVRMRAMTGGNSYNNAYTPLSFNFIWNTAYSDLFPDIDQLISIAETPGSEIPTYAGAGKIMKAYILMTLVDLFGDVPLSEIGQGVSLPSPKADDQEAIYATALTLIDAAIADFSATSPSIGSNDLFYGGDSDKWLKFANSLKLKYLVTTRLVGGSGGDINSLIGNVILNSDEDFQFNFGNNRSNPDSRQFNYSRQYENGAVRYLSNYYMWSLSEEKGIPDPRLRYYFYRQDLAPELADAFTLDCNSIPRPLHYNGPYPWCTAASYWGRDHGDAAGIPPDTDRRSVHGVYPAGGSFDNGTGGSVQNSGTDGGKGAGIAPIMLSSFVQFMLAEAVLTMGANGDAKAFLEAGIRQSISKVMDFGSMDNNADASLFPTAEEVDAYVALVLSNYDAADAAGKLDIVIKEYHIALWGNGIEAYNAYRRTGYPSGMQPTKEPNPGEFTRSMFYPADFVNLNATANQKSVTEQVFWDTNPAGFIQ